MLRRFVFLPLLLLTLNGQLSFAEASKPRLGLCSRVLATGAAHFIVLSVYPALATVEAIELFVKDKETSWWRKAYRVPLEFLRRQLKNKYLPAFVLAALIGDRTLLTTSELFDEFPEYYEEMNEDSVVVFVAGDDSFFGFNLGVGRAIYSSDYGKRGINSLFVSASTQDGLVEKLRWIRKEHGPITHIEFLGHGSSGYARLKEERLTSDSELYLKGVFAKGARVVVRSCSAASGEEGELFLRRLGEGLLDQGGTIVGSRITYSNGFSNVYLQGAGPLLEPFLVPASAALGSIFYSLETFVFQDRSSIFEDLLDPVLRVEIPPRGSN